MPADHAGMNNASPAPQKVTSVGIRGKLFGLVAAQAAVSALCIASSSISLPSVTGIAGLLVVVLSTGWVVRSITQPLASITDAAERIAAGELDVEVEASGDDEIGRLADAIRGSVELSRAFSDTRARMAAMVGDIARGSEKVGSASGEMAQSGHQAGLAVGEIADAIGSVAHGAESQVRALGLVRRGTAEGGAGAHASG